MEMHASGMMYNLLGSTGMRVSHLSMGGAALSNIYGDYDEPRGVAMVRECLDLGINYIETGPWYGQGSSERILGKALRGVPRRSFFLASKVGRYDVDVRTTFDFSYQKTTAAVDKTLRLLGVNYVDIIQIHDLSFAPDKTIILRETLPALKKAVFEGKCRFIGLADYNLDLMKEILEESNVKISTILCYAKATMFDNRLQKYTEYFKDKGVGVINASATGMGLLTNAGPQPWHPATGQLKQLCESAADYCKEQNVELARLALWFTLNQPDIDTNVCGFTTAAQLQDTINVLTKGLTNREMVAYDEVLHRFFGEKNYNWDTVETPVFEGRLSEALAM